MVNHPFNAKLPVFFKLLSQMIPAVSGEIFYLKYWLPRSRMFYPTLIPVHCHLREEELVQLLPFTFAGFDVLTSDASGEGVQLDPLAGYQLLLQGRHQQGPGTIHIANVVLLPEQRDLTTNANMILFKFAI